MIIILFLITVLGPAIFWLWFFSWRDRAEPEPKKFLFKLFLLGVGLSLVAYAVEGTIFSLVFNDRYEDMIAQSFSDFQTEAHLWEVLLVVAIGGMMEEVLKYLSLKEFVYTNKNFNQISDGIIYGVTLALGFSTIENAGYFISIYSFDTTSVLVVTSIFRGISTTLLHITAAGIIGYALGRMKYTQSHGKGIIVKSLFLAMLLHAAYNVFSMFEAGIVMGFLITFVAFLYLNKKFGLHDSKLVWELKNPR